MAIYALIGALLMFGFVFWAMRREPKLSGFYSQLHICGRWSAFFAIYLLMTAVVGVVMSVVLMLNDSDTSAAMIIVVIVTGVVCFFLGFSLYQRIQKKCPEHLRKRLLRDMIIICLGTLFRVCFFIVAFIVKTWWLYSAPTVYEVNGKILYRYPGSYELYDEYGFHRGKLDNSGIVTTAILD